MDKPECTYAVISGPFTRTRSASRGSAGPHDAPRKGRTDAPTGRPGLSRRPHLPQTGWFASEGIPGAHGKANELVASTRQRIPLLMAEDCIHGHSFWLGATIFPTQLSMACTWDPVLIERVARTTAVEVSATGLHWTFSPVLCIARDPGWGQVNETFGEDPYLIGELGAAMIRGYQGDGLHDRTAVLATAKHFAGYSDTQGVRDASEADHSPRKLCSWFLPPSKPATTS